MVTLQAQRGASARGTAGRLALSGVTKSFGPIVANEDVSLVVEAGRIHSVVGENGAGKTTLMRIAYGLEQPDAGTVAVRGRAVEDHNPRKARALGLGMVHQHFTLVPTMTVAENVLLGEDGFRVRVQEAVPRLRELSREHGLEVDPGARAENLSVALKQRAEILKMLYRDAEILILDEPTAVLSPAETHELLDTLQRFKEAGKAIVFVSHKLPEVLAISDDITVLRRARAVAQLQAGEATEASLARLMVGHLPERVVRKVADRPSEDALEVESLSVPSTAMGSGLDEVSLAVHGGEIVGIAAVAGNGQRELIRAIFGLATPRRGRILLAGRDITSASTARRRELGISYLPENRLGEGININESVEDNLILGLHRRPPQRGLVRLRRSVTRRLARSLVEEYGIRVANLGVTAGTLSGGNLQRLIAARELATSPVLLLAEEPNWGLDVQAAAFMQEQLLALRNRGTAILLVSADLDELAQLADRIVVLYRGRVAGEISASNSDSDQIGALMMGGRQA